MWDDQQADLGPAPAHRRPGKVLHGRYVHAEAEEEKHGEEEKGLVCGEATHQPLALQRGLPRVDDRAWPDVRIGVHLVGVGVVAVVLAHPPAVAHTQQGVPGQEPDSVVEPGAREHLVVPGVVQLEPELARNPAQGHRVENQQPWVVHDGEEKQAGRQHQRVGDDNHRVVARLLPEQPGKQDLALEASVVSRCLWGRADAGAQHQRPVHHARRCHGQLVPWAA